MTLQVGEEWYIHGTINRYYMIMLQMTLVSKDGEPVAQRYQTMYSTVAKQPHTIYESEIRKVFMLRWRRFPASLNWERIGNHRLIISLIL